MSKCVPLIVILGGTGTGKSKLAIEIAKRYGSEIISADSMQVYKGLDILTNKVTPAERAEVPHHLIDFVSPLKNFTVIDFRAKALPIIERLLHAGKPPVVVGGTNYYIESLVWQILVENYKPSETDSDVDDRRIDIEVSRKLGFRPMSNRKSTGVKRKLSDFSAVKQKDTFVKFLSVFNELKTLLSYPNKVLESLKQVIVVEVDSDNRLETTIDNVIIMKSVGDIDKIITVFREILDECGCKDDLDASLKCFSESLTLKNNLNKIVRDLMHKLSLTGEFSNDISVVVDEIHKRLEKSNRLSEQELRTVQDVVDSVRSVLEPHMGLFIGFLGRRGEIDADVDDLPSQQLYEYLKTVDPEYASNLHPNNKRKIIRSLEIWAVSGRKHSDILKEQQQNGSILGGPLRFNNTIIFWLTADSEVLKMRLDDRTQAMLELGLVNELLEFYAEYKPKNDDFTKGIFQSIGLKEFRDYLALTDEEKNSDVGEKKLKEGFEMLKLVTKRYVKKQNKWVKNRFLKCSRDVPPVYKIDTTNIDNWDELVLEPAIDVIDKTMCGRSQDSKLQPLPQEVEMTDVEIKAMKFGKFHCDVCDRVFIGELQWNEHLKSEKHRKVVKKKSVSRISKDDVTISEGDKKNDLDGSTSKSVLSLS